MKFPKLPFAGTLLVCYVVYSAFVPVSTPHSIILFSLSLLTGFELYIQSHKTPRTEKLLADIRNEMLQTMERDRDTFEKKLKELHEEQTRQSIARANSQSGAPKKAPIQF